MNNTFMAITTAEGIDKEVRKHLVLVSDLLSQKNLLLSIFRLPPETLAIIFIHAARNYHEGNDHSGFRVPHWVGISYVCRHWRDVALSCPTLWTYHFTVSLRWTEELLARSKQAPLKIRIEHNYHRGTEWWLRILEKVWNHAERIQELRLDTPNNVLPAELSFNATTLQILDIHNWWSHSERTFRINNGNTLRLHTLKLTKSLLPWQSTFDLSGITTLFLCYVPSPSQQDVVEFLTTLSRMQALTTLHLEHALPSARDFLSSGAFSVFPRVTLPCLVHLFVHALPSTAVALLSCTNIPLRTKVGLEIESGDDSSIDDFSQLHSALAHRFSQSEDPSSSSPEIRSLTIRFCYDSGFTFIASECDDPDLLMSFLPQECHFPLMIRVTIDQLVAIRHSACIVGDICCSIPSTHVQTLHIVQQPSFSDDLWRKTLGHLGGLRYMKLSYGYMPDIYSLLTRRAQDPGENIAGDRDLAPGHAFVPGLEELELDHITFSCGDFDYLADIVLSKQSLLDAVATRKALHLTMTRCDVRVQEDELEDEDDESDACECGLCILGIGHGH